MAPANALAQLHLQCSEKACNDLQTHTRVEKLVRHGCAPTVTDAPKPSHSPAHPHAVLLSSRQDCAVEVQVDGALRLGSGLGVEGEGLGVGHKTPVHHVQPSTTK